MSAANITERGASAPIMAAPTKPKNRLATTTPANTNPMIVRLRGALMAGSPRMTRALTLKTKMNTTSVMTGPIRNGNKVKSREPMRDSSLTTRPANCG